MTDVLFHPEAEAEYQTALAWYQSRSAQAATKFEEEVERVLGVIAATPELYPEYDDEHRFAVVRRYPFSIVYRIHQDNIYVIAIAHSSRATGYWKHYS